MSDARPEVLFYYSIGSRYSYLASTQIESLEMDTGCPVRWRPLFSGALMGLRGTNPFEGTPVSGQYEWAYRQSDAEAWAAYYGAPYREPADHGHRHNPRLLATACVAADRQGFVREYSQRLFRAVFVEGVALIDEAECVRQAVVLGLSGDDFLAQLTASATTEALLATAQEARARGAFGVPTFVVGDRMFWGNDRLVLVRHYLQTHHPR